MTTHPATSTPTVDLDWPSDRPELLPFLPLVYVAWSDGTLEAEELSTICDRIESQSWLEPEARTAVQRWLQPDSPPSAAALQRLRERARELAPASGTAEARLSLIDLGIELARSQAGEDGPWQGDEARAALEEIEEALGVVGHEAARTLTGAPASTASVETRPSRTRAGFDPDSMRRFLDEPYPALRRRVLDLLADEAFEFPMELDRETYREQTLAAVQRLADEGLGGLAFPESTGGASEPGQAVTVFETLAFGDLSVLVKFGVQFGLFGGSVYQLGTSRHHERYLGPIARLELPGCFAMTERGHGSNVRDIETTATYDADTDEIVVHSPTETAGKHWIGNAALHGRMASVFAQLRVGGEEHGVHVVLVPIRDDDGDPLPGVRIADNGAKEGLNGVDNGQIWFDRVRVPRGNLLDRFATITEDGRYESAITSAGRRFFTMLGTLVAGRISIAAASVSAAKTGVTIAVRYSCARRQFGPSGEGEVPILTYLTQQRALFPKLAATYGLHFAARRLTADYAELEKGDGAAGSSPSAESEEARRRLEVDAAGLKAYASRHCIDTLQLCREALGGQGYLAANRFGRLKADTDVFATFEGANVVLLQLVARGLLSEYQEAMGDLKLWDMVRYIADRAGTRVTELNPVVTRRTDEDHLLDGDFHHAAFEYRRERLLGSVARRLKTLLDDDVDSFEAMNLCQDHLVKLARAYVEEQVLEAFHDGVKRAPAPGLSEALRSLSQLWALERIEADRAWYLEAGYLEPPKSKAIRAQVNALCREVAEDARFVVDGFGIPDDVLRAPDGTSPGG